MLSHNQLKLWPSNKEVGVSKEIVKKKRFVGGKPTTDLVFSAYTADNSQVFPIILELHVPKDSVVADVTYVKGVFWKNVRVVQRISHGCLTASAKSKLGSHRCRK
jgi:hypothetical protein